MRKITKKILSAVLFLSLLAGMGAVASFASEYLECSEENQNYIVRNDLSLFILGNIPTCMLKNIPTDVDCTAAIIRDGGKNDKIIVVFENDSLRVVKFIKEERTNGVLHVPKTLFNEYGEVLVLNFPKNIEVETVKTYSISGYIAI